MWTGSESADIFFVILHRTPLAYDSMPAEFLYNLTKKSVGASSAQALCSVALTISEQEISAFVDKFLEAIPDALKIKLMAA